LLFPVGDEGPIITVIGTLRCLAALFLWIVGLAVLEGHHLRRGSERIAYKDIALVDFGSKGTQGHFGHTTRTKHAWHLEVQCHGHDSPLILPIKRPRGGFAWRVWTIMERVDQGRPASVAARPISSQVET
jgi:hypothetical protein